MQFLLPSSGLPRLNVLLKGVEVRVPIGLRATVVRCGALGQRRAQYLTRGVLFDVLQDDVAVRFHRVLAHSRRSNAHDRWFRLRP